MFLNDLNVKELELESPSAPKIEDWEKEALDTYREKNYLGRPEYSLELHLLSGTDLIMDESYSRVQPLMEDLTVLACFKDITVQDFLDAHTNETYDRRRQEIDEQYVNKADWEMESYLRKIHDAIPDHEVSLNFFSEEAEIENLKHNKEMAKNVEKLMRDNENYVTTGIDFEAYAEGSNPQNVLGGLKEDLSIELYFLYGGNPELTEEFNEITSQYNDHTNYSGVPGLIQFGKGMPESFFLHSDELSQTSSMVQRWINENLEAEMEN